MRRAFIGVAGQTVPLPRRLALGAGAGARRRAWRSPASSPTVRPPRPGSCRATSLLALDGERVTGADDLVRLLGGDRIGADTTLSVIAGSELKKVVVVPAERSEGQGQ